MSTQRAQLSLMLLGSATVAGIVVSLGMFALPAQARCNTLGLMNYTLEPANGQACLSGWMNVGGGYCRKK